MVLFYRIHRMLFHAFGVTVNAAFDIAVSFLVYLRVATIYIDVLEVFQLLVSPVMIPQRRVYQILISNVVISIQYIVDHQQNVALVMVLPPLHVKCPVGKISKLLLQ